jgi:hypothetical protein
MFPKESITILFSNPGSGPKKIKISRNLNNKKEHKIFR